MNIKKFLLAAILLIVIIPGACSQTAGTAQQSDWSIAVVGAEKTEFTSADYAKLSAVTVEATLKTKDGTKKTQKYEGVLLKDVLEYLGAGEYTSITVEAPDYKKDYTPEIVSDPMTILVVEADGQPLGDTGPVESVAGSQMGNMWINNVSKITVNK